jgi:hypothetical protein
MKIQRAVTCTIRRKCALVLILAVTWVGAYSGAIRNKENGDFIQERVKAAMSATSGLRQLHYARNTRLLQSDSTYRQLLEDRQRSFIELAHHATGSPSRDAVRAVLDVATAMPLYIRPHLRVLHDGADPDCLNDYLVYGSAKVLMFAGPRSPDPLEGVTPPGMYVHNGHVVKLEVQVDGLPEMDEGRFNVPLVTDVHTMHSIGSIGSLPVVGVYFNHTFFMDMEHLPALCYEVTNEQGELSPDTSGNAAVCAVGDAILAVESRKEGFALAKALVMRAIDQDQAIRRSVINDPTILNPSDIHYVAPDGEQVKQQTVTAAQTVTEGLTAFPATSSDTNDDDLYNALEAAHTALAASLDGAASPELQILFQQTKDTLNAAAAQGWHTHGRLLRPTNDVKAMSSLPLATQLVTMRRLLMRANLRQSASHIKPFHAKAQPTGNTRNLNMIASYGTGAQTMLVVSVFFSDETASVVPLPANVITVMNRATAIWQRESRGKLVMTYTFPASCTYNLSSISKAQAIASYTDLYNAANTAAANHPTPSCRYTSGAYSKFVILHSGGFPYCGIAQTPGTVSWIATTCLEAWVIAHESGHNFGFLHAYTMNPFTNVALEYGDVTDIMGAARLDWNGLSYSTAVKDGAGWLPAIDILTITPPASTSYALTGGAHWFGVANPLGYQSVVAPNGLAAASALTAAITNNMPGGGARSTIATIVATERNITTGYNIFNSMGGSYATVRVPSGQNTVTDWLYLTVRSDWGDKDLDGVQLHEISFSYNVFTADNVPTAANYILGKPLLYDTRPYSNELLDADLEVGQRFIYRGYAGGAAEIASGVPCSSSSSYNQLPVWRKLLIEPIGRATHLYTGTPVDAVTNTAANTSMSVRFTWLNPRTGLRPEGLGCHPDTSVDMSVDTSVTAASTPSTSSTSWCLGSGVGPPAAAGSPSSAPLSIPTSSSAPFITCGTRSFMVNLTAANPVYVFRLLPATSQASTTQTASVHTCGTGATPVNSNTDIAFFRGVYPSAAALFRANISLGASDYTSSRIVVNSTASILYQCGWLTTLLDESEPLYVAVSFTAASGLTTASALTSTTVKTVTVTTSCDANGQIDVTGRFIYVTDIAGTSYDKGVYQLSSLTPIFNGRRMWVTPDIFGKLGTLGYAYNAWQLTATATIKPENLNQVGAWSSVTTTSHEPFSFTQSNSAATWSVRTICPPGLFASSTSNSTSVTCLACGPFMRPVPVSGAVTASNGADVCFCAPGAEPNITAPFASSGTRRGCQQCAAGYYKIQADNSACIKCTNGTTSLPGSVTSIACRPIAPFCSAYRVSLGNAFFEGIYAISSLIYNNNPVYNRTATLSNGAVSSMFIHKLYSGNWVFAPTSALDSHYTTYEIGSCGPPQTWNSTYYIGTQPPSIPNNITCLCQGVEEWSATELRCVPTPNRMPCPAGTIPVASASQPSNSAVFSCVSCSSPSGVAGAGAALFAAASSAAAAGSGTCGCPSGYTLSTVTDAVGSVAVCAPPSAVAVSFAAVDGAGANASSSLMAAQKHLTGIYVRIPTLLTAVDLTAQARIREVKLDSSDSNYTFFPVYKRATTGVFSTWEQELASMPRYLWYAPSRREWSLSATLPPVSRVISASTIHAPITAASGMAVRQLAALSVGVWPINYNASGNVSILSDIEDESLVPARFAFLPTDYTAGYAGALPLNGSMAAIKAALCVVSTTALATNDGSITAVNATPVWAVYDAFSTAFLPWHITAAPVPGQVCCCFMGGPSCSGTLDITSLSPLGGSLSGCTTDAIAALLFDAPEHYFTVIIPDDTAGLNISLCSSSSSWNSALYVVKGGCLRGGLSILAEGVAASNDDGCGTVDGHASIFISYPAAGTYYVLLTGGAGSGSRDGAYNLEWNLTSGSRTNQTQSPAPSPASVPVVYCVTPTPSPTVTTTPSITTTSSPTNTETITQTVTWSPLRSSSASESVTPTYSSTNSGTGDVSVTGTRTAAASALITSTNSATRSETGTPASTVSSSVSASNSLSGSASSSPSSASSASLTLTPTSSGTPSPISSLTGSTSATPHVTASSSWSAAVSASSPVTVSSTCSDSATPSPTASNSATPSETESTSATPSETESTSAMPSPSATASSTEDISDSLTPTASETASSSASTDATHIPTTAITRSITASSSVTSDPAVSEAAKLEGNVTVSLANSGFAWNYTRLMEVPTLLADVVHHMLCDLLIASGAADNDGSVSVLSVGTANAPQSITTSEIFPDGTPTCPYIDVVTFTDDLASAVVSSDVAGVSSNMFTPGLVFHLSYTSARAAALQSALMEDDSVAPISNSLSNTIESLSTALSIPVSSFQTTATVPSGPPSSPQPTPSSSITLYIIIGAAGGGLVILLVLIGCCICCLRKPNNQPSSSVVSIQKQPSLRRPVVNASASSQRRMNATGSVRTLQINDSRPRSPISAGSSRALYASEVRPIPLSPSGSVRNLQRTESRPKLLVRTPSGNLSRTASQPHTLTRTHSINDVQPQVRTPRTLSPVPSIRAINVAHEAAALPPRYSATGGAMNYYRTFPPVAVAPPTGMSGRSQRRVDL